MSAAVHACIVMYSLCEESVLCSLTSGRSVWLVVQHVFCRRTHASRIIKSRKALKRQHMLDKGSQHHPPPRWGEGGTWLLSINLWNNVELGTTDIAREKFGAVGSCPPGEWGGPCESGQKRLGLVIKGLGLKINKPLDLTFTFSLTCLGNTMFQKCRFLGCFTPFLGCFAPLGGVDP